MYKNATYLIFTMTRQELYINKSCMHVISNHHTTTKQNTPPTKTISSNLLQQYQTTEKKGKYADYFFLLSELTDDRICKLFFLRTKVLISYYLQISSYPSLHTHALHFLSFSLFVFWFKIQFNCFSFSRWSHALHCICTVCPTLIMRNAVPKSCCLLYCAICAINEHEMMIIMMMSGYKLFVMLMCVQEGKKIVFVLSSI